MKPANLYKALQWASSKVLTNIITAWQTCQYKESQKNTVTIWRHPVSSIHSSNQQIYSRHFGLSLSKVTKEYQWHQYVSNTAKVQVQSGWSVLAPQLLRKFVVGIELMIEFHYNYSTGPKHWGLLQDADTCRIEAIGKYAKWTKPIETDVLTAWLFLRQMTTFRG